MKLTLHLSYPGLLLLALKLGDWRTATLALLVLHASIVLLDRLFSAKAKATSARPLPSLAWIPTSSILLLGVAYFFSLQSLPWFLPVGVNAIYLFAFLGSLQKDQRPALEHFALMIHPDLPENRKPHLRQFTWFWCIFFICNIAITAFLTQPPWRSLWAWWTGALAYGCMGLLFATEWVVRKMRFG